MRSKLAKTSSSRSNGFFANSGKRSSNGIQAKLKTNKPGDQYEVEADKTADHVVGQSMGSILSSKSSSPGADFGKPLPVTLRPSVSSSAQRKEEDVQAKESENQNENEELDVQLKESEIAPMGMSDKDLGEEDPIRAQAIQTKESSSAESTEDEGVQLKESVNTSQPDTHTQIDQKLSDSKGSGSPLSNDVKIEMENKFGVDFTNIRIHTDSRAESMNQDLGAQAFTYKDNIYFNKGKFNPYTKEGKFLLAHELTHTIQQGNGINVDLQRTEVDTSSKPDLKDSESRIDEHVNKILDKKRKNIKNYSSAKSRIDFVKSVYHRIGKMSNIFKYQSKIEVWVEKKLGKDYYDLPEQETTKYKGVDIGIIWKKFQVLGPTMKVAGIYIGSDKLGHFFHEGYEYFKRVYNFLNNNDNLSVDDQSIWPSETDMSSELGHKFEMGNQGVSTTGVYSFADLEANASGYSFYLDIFRDPNIKFNIRNYMREVGAEEVGDNSMEGITVESMGTSWNEERNRNFYRSDIAKIVWGNLLSGEWIGAEGRPDGLKDVSLNLKSDKNSEIEGELSFMNVENLSKQFLNFKGAKIDYLEGNPFGKLDENSQYKLIKGIKIESLLSDGQYMTILSRGETEIKAYLRETPEDTPKKVITFTKGN